MYLSVDRSERATSISADLTNLSLRGQIEQDRHTTTCADVHDQVRRFSAQVITDVVNQIVVT